MSSAELFLGIDLGTTGVKATLVDENWHVVGQSRVEYPIYRAQDFWAEQDPSDWWSATCTAIQALTRGRNETANNICAIGVSSQAPTLLGMDRDGAPVGSAMIWMDRRSDESCHTLQEQVGENAIRQITGNRIDPYYMLPKLLWQKNHEPERYHQTDQYIQANGWIIYRLTNQVSIDATHAALTQLYNIHQENWDDSLLKTLGIAASKLPHLYEATDVVGHLTKEASRLLHLPEGIPVVAGAIDGATAPLGLGLTQAGQAFEMSGQSSGIGVILDRPLHHPNLALLKHALSGKWILKGSMSATGGSLQWFRDLIDEKTGVAEVYEEYEAAVQSISPGAEGLVYLPYLAGERAPIWDSYARGVFFGLHLKTGKAHLIRAIMEGTAFGLKSILEEMEQAGIQIGELFGTGGGYRSEQWTGMKASILERDIRVLSPLIETASLGAAYLALLSSRSLSILSIPPVLPGRTHKPNPNAQPVYRNHYRIFKNLYERNKDLFKSLHMAGEAQ
jgi:xylulokinase